MFDNFTSKIFEKFKNNPGFPKNKNIKLKFFLQLSVIFLKANDFFFAQELEPP